MNIFLLDYDQDEAVKRLCDRHVVKMVLETAQILCTAQQLSGNTSKLLYRATHKNHPCVQWCLRSSQHYEWLYKYFLSILDEYSYRYCRVHACSRLVGPLKRQQLADNGLTFDFNCTNNNIKDVIESYREYYKYKSTIMDFKFTGREEYANICA